MKAPKANMIAAAVMVMLVGCAETPSGLQRGDFVRQLSDGEEIEESEVVEREEELEAATATKVLGPRGGVIEAGGVRLVVPKGALASEVAITINVPAGTTLAAELLPHGLTFSKGASLGFDLAGTPYDELEKDVAESELLGVFHKGAVNARRVKPAEKAPVRISDEFVTFKIYHFSNYAVTKKGLILVGG